MPNEQRAGPTPHNVARELQKARREDSLPLPTIDSPDGWSINDPMVCPQGTETSLRSESWEWHIDVASAPPDATIEGPIWAELKRQVGGESSFETRPCIRFAAVEPGAVQAVIEDLAALAALDDTLRELEETTEWLPESWVVPPWSYPGDSGRVKTDDKPVGWYSLSRKWGRPNATLRWVRHDSEEDGPVVVSVHNSPWNPNTNRDDPPEMIEERDGLNVGDVEETLKSLTEEYGDE